MTEGEFIALWHEEQYIYRAWGDCVFHNILKNIEVKFGNEGAKRFLQIASPPRIKELNSMLDKAFYRRKQYQDPYIDIKDKVGVRFVVLHTKHLEELKSYIDCADLWSTVPDRDYLATRENAPEVFGYEASHYIMEAKEGCQWEGILIPKGTPCEVQLKTLLQHAYGELAHDTIYKPKTEVTARAKRYCAKAMALIEATDDYFLTVIREIEKAEEAMSSTEKTLGAMYQDILTLHPEPNRFNEELIHAYTELLTSNWDTELTNFYKNNNWLVSQIRTEYPNRYLLRQPAILLVLYLISTKKVLAERLWPDTKITLEPLFTILGETMIG